MTQLTTSKHQYLEYLGVLYEFAGEKDGLLCYTFKPNLIDDADGSTIIVKRRKDKREVDQFYVLFLIVGGPLSDYNGSTTMVNLNGMTRMAHLTYPEEYLADKCKGRFAKYNKRENLNQDSLFIFK